MAEDQHSLVGAAALDALEPGERAAFEAHLRTCDDCRRELASLQATLGQLALTAGSVPPPGRLRDEVLARVARTRQQPPVVTPLRRSRRAVQWLAAAAAAVVFVALGTTVVVQQQRISDRDQQISAQERRAEQAAALLRATPEVVALPAGGELAYATAAGAALVEIRDTASPGAGRQWELWVVPDGGVPRPSGLVEGTDGRFVLTDIEDAVAIAVSNEPAGGSQQPTTTPFVVEL
ncbi:anti-sigma factor [Motilibacter aurantiacus]|uniref:anti-sigma factor n=1 Tax=Motilibacter aurantiacus TaxID=2714955 RepID=UPI0014080045|nr:anti-sigma factor [Motilibacter aurantiacus]